MDDEFPAEPHCPACGTVMHRAWGGYVCRGCGFTDPTPWVDRPDESDGFPGIHGG